MRNRAELLEREKGFEPSTSTLARWSLLPQFQHNRAEIPQRATLRTCTGSYRIARDCTGSLRAGLVIGLVSPVRS
jgi:hypothetical protein